MGPGGVQNLKNAWGREGEGGRGREWGEVGAWGEGTVSARHGLTWDAGDMHGDAGDMHGIT